MHYIIVGLSFNAFDFLTGMIGGIKHKCLSSSKMRDGLFKKVGFILCYVLAIMVDKNGKMIGINTNELVLPAVVAYVVLTEVISIIENIHNINSDLLPEKILNLFHITNTLKKEEK